jgi:hypothetical protein
MLHKGVGRGVLRSPNYHLSKKLERKQCSREGQRNCFLVILIQNIFLAFKHSLVILRQIKMRLFIF